jgi:general secretion pathway protein C
MKTLFSPKNIKIFIFILSLMLLVKLGWFITEMTILSARGVDYMKPSETKSLYYRTRFAAQKLKQEQVTKKVPLSDIKSIKLLAIYHSQNHVVITVSKKSKTSVMVRGDKIDGYVLDAATAQEAIFLRDGKSYRIRLVESSGNSKGKSSVRYVSEKPTKPENQAVPKGEVTEADGLTIVDRTLLDHYSKNMNDIWKNIGIKEIKEGDKIKGFKVNFVKRGSDFSKLGLRRGDVIKSINGQELNSYNSAFEIYKNIDTMDGLTLKIMRGKEEMELEYEIN